MRVLRSQRNSQSHRKAKQVLTSGQAPRPLRAVPPNGNMPVRPRPLAGGHADTQVMDAVIEADAKIGITHYLPKVSPTDLPTVHPHTPFTPLSGHPAPPSLLLDAVKAAEVELELDATQVLPTVRALLDGSPSEYWERIHEAELAFEARAEDGEDLRSVDDIVASAETWAAHNDRWLTDSWLEERIAARRDNRLAEFAMKWRTQSRHEDAIALGAVYTHGALLVETGEAPEGVTATAFTKDMAKQIQDQIVADALAASAVTQ